MARKTSCLFVLVLMPCLRSNADGIDIGRTVGWQEHSKNDLSGWPQMLKKGGRNFKIDPQYMRSNDCRYQINAKNDDRGCLILNHDTAIRGVDWRSDYNTLNQVLDFIALSENDRYFGNHTRTAYPEPFLFVLCFKNSPVCQKSKQGSNWYSLVNDFYLKATQVIKARSLNVEFVLDGDAAGASICTCLKDSWRPWNATWIPGGGQSPSDCVSQAFHSNNRMLGDDRFQILNEPSSKFNDAVTQRYGKFINSTYNYQIYEPKDQAEITERVMEYLDADLLHVAGLKFAINIDAAMLQIYTAGAATPQHPTVGKLGGWNFALQKNSSSPKVVVVNGMGSSLVAVILSIDRISNTVTYSLGSFSGGAGSKVNHILSNKTLEWNSGTISSLSAIQDFYGAPLILASTSTGTIVGYHVSIGLSNTTNSLQKGAKLSNGSLVTINKSLPSHPNAKSSVTTVGCPDQSNFLCIAQVVFSTVEPELFLWSLDPKMNEVLLGSIKLDEATLGSDFALIDVTNESPQAPTIAIAWSRLGWISIAFVQWSSDTSEWAIRTSGLVTPGTNPHLAFTEVDKGEGILLLVNDFGTCQNNEKQNKNAAVSVCKQTPLPSQNVLTYTYGNVLDFETMLRNGTRANACHDTIMHGAYDRGIMPTAAVFPVLTLEGYSILATHTTVLDGNTGSEDVPMCGLSALDSDATAFVGWTPALLN